MRRKSGPDVTQFPMCEEDREAAAVMAAARERPENCSLCGRPLDGAPLLFLL